MTEVPDVVAQWLATLPDRIRRHVHTTTRVITAVHRALAHGWTVRALAVECSRDLDGVHGDSIGAVVVSRLDRAAQIEPKPALKTFTQPLPWCGFCSDQHARWRQDGTGRCHCWTQPTPGDGK